MIGGIFMREMHQFPQNFARRCFEEPKSIRGFRAKANSLLGVSGAVPCLAIARE